MPLKYSSTFRHSHFHSNTFASQSSRKKRTESAMPEYLTQSRRQKDSQAVQSYRQAEHDYFVQLAEDKYNDTSPSPRDVQQSKTTFHKRSTTSTTSQSHRKPPHNNKATQQQRAKTLHVKTYRTSDSSEHFYDGDTILISCDDQNSNSSPSTTSDSEASVDLNNNNNDKQSTSTSQYSRPLTFKDLKRRMSFRLRKFSTLDFKQTESLENDQLTQPSSAKLDHIRTPVNRTFSLLAKSLSNSRVIKKVDDDNTSVDDHHNNNIVVDDKAEHENEQLLDKLGHLEMTVFESESLQERVKSLEHALDVVREDANDIRDYALTLIE